jgi:hypothetical protein
MSDPKDETSTKTTYSWRNSTNWLGPIVVKTRSSHVSAPSGDTKVSINTIVQ